MDLLELLRKRRSIRKYTAEPVPEITLEKILQAGLLAPSSRGIDHVRLVLVQDKETLQRLSRCKLGSEAVLANADAAVVVLGDTEKSDVWTEDCSVCMTLMMLEATEQGIGRCWVQCRKRKASDGTDAEEFVRELLSIPERFGVLAILTLGLPAEEPAHRELPDTDSPKIRRIN